MTRADEPPAGVEHRVFGSPGAERTIILLRTGPAAMLDPDPPATTARAVSVVVLGLADHHVEDPATFGGQTPGEQLATILADLVRSRSGESPVGLVGVGAAGPLALLLAAELGHGVDRLALVAVPAPSMPIDRDDEELVTARVSAKTLIMNGQGDPDAALAAAGWHRDRLPGSRVEMVPASALPAGDGRLALSVVWERVLAHVAPGTKLP